MANDWCDGFLELVLDGQPVEGECSDAAFPNAIEIMSFRFGDSSGFSDEKGDTKYADQRLGQKRAAAKAERGRALEADDESYGLESLFSWDGASDFESHDLGMTQFEGKDLAEEAACNFQITKEMDHTSPDLFKAYCSMQDLENREVFDSATLSLRKATGATRAVFLEYIFTDVLVVGYTLELGPEGSPKETINFSFAKVHCEYKPQANTGELGDVVQGGWDFIERGTC